jgi:hypothetical protein
MRAQDCELAEARSVAHFFRGQLTHLLALGMLIPIAWSFAAPALDGDQWLGLRDIEWFWLIIAVSVVHQVYIWIAWRAQLGWGSLSRLFGRADLAVWALTFMPLLIARPFLLTGLAVADAGSLALPRGVSWLLAGALLIPSTYSMYSVVRYFGITRAMGADHFRAKYRHMPLVKQGAFAWSSNAMYTLVFLFLWAIALSAGSLAALAAAFFQHAYIWVHYHCTEKPDMQLLYGGNV